MQNIDIQIGPNKDIKWTKSDIEMAIAENDINKKIGDETMLMHSIKTDDYNLAKKLIELGADKSIGDNQNRTPLWLCTIYNNATIAELLIKSGADMEEEYGHNSPLYNAIKHDNNEVASVLLKLGANPNLKNRDDQTPLHCATFRKNYKMVKMLLEYGADKNIKNNIKLLPGEISFEMPQKQTPYEIALEKDDKKLISLFEMTTVKEKKEQGNDNISEKDLNKFYYYLVNNNKVIEETEKLEEFFDDYKEVYIKNKNSCYKTQEDLFNEVNSSINVKEVVMKYYSSEYSVFEKKRDELDDIDRKIIDIENNEKVTLLNVFFKEFGFTIGLCLPFISYFLTCLLVYNEMILLGIIFVFITFGSCSLIGEFVDEFETKFSKVTYILTCIFNVAIPFGAAFMFNTSSNVNIMLFSIMALASYIITTLMYDIEKFNSLKKSKEKSAKELKNLIFQKEKQIEKMKLDVNDLCDEIDEKKIKLKKEFDKIANKKIDIEELDDNLVEIYNNKCKTLFEEQAIVIDRWNKFTEFRKKHYIREVEERIEESGIINDILKLTFNNVKINKYKINSKNYEDYGEISDYKKYIYDCIDSEEEQL